MTINPEVRIEMARAFGVLVSELKNESDRGSVVLAIAWVEDELTKLLKQFCLPSPKKDDELFGVSSPIGNFSAKIDLAYRLGLIREDLKKCLHLCRRLRNNFAHLTGQKSFAESSVKDRVQEIFRLNETLLKVIWQQLKKDEEFKARYPNESSICGSHGLENVLGTRTLFDFTMAIIVSGLICSKGDVQPISQLVE